MPRLRAPQQDWSLWTVEKTEDSNPEMRLVRRYLTYRLNVESRSKSTVSREERWLVRWTLFLAERGASLKEATQDDIAACLVYFDGRRWSPSMRGHVISSLRQFHAWLCRQELADRNPWDAVRRPGAAQRMPRYLTPDEFEKLVAGFDRPNWRDIRDRAVCEWMWATACRVGETCDINVDDIDFENRRAVVNGGHTHREGEVFFTPRCEYWLRLYLTRVRPILNKRPNGALFLGTHGERLGTDIVRQALVRAATRAKLGRHVHPHMLRHSAATHLLSRGVDIRYVQEILRHKNLATTQIYTHVARQNLRRAYDAAMTGN